MRCSAGARVWFNERPCPLYLRDVSACHEQDLTDEVKVTSFLVPVLGKKIGKKISKVFFTGADTSKCGVSGPLS
jgi:hypothetical protein